MDSRIQIHIPSEPVYCSDSEYRKKSLWQKLSDSYHDRHHDPFISRYSNALSLAFFWFICVSLLHLMIAHIIPLTYAEYDVMQCYYMKVAAWFVFVQVASNWMCIRFYDSILRQSDEVRHRNARRIDDEHCNGLVQNGFHDDASDPNDKVGLPWSNCKKCSMEIPFRTHHCVLCNKCILKRDHHCYMTGMCIGFYNQRYFIVMNLYLLIGSIWGFYDISRYIGATLLVDSNSKWDFFLPMTCVRWLFGSIQFHHMLMMWQLYTLWWTGIAAGGFVFWNFFLIFLGKTSHEMSRNLPVRCTASVADNLRSVFGAFWLLNFIFPAVILFRQEGDGCHWYGLRQRAKVQSLHSRQ